MDINPLINFSNVFARKARNFQRQNAFLQPAYTIFSNPKQDIKSFDVEVGGILRFYIKEHLAIGTIGGTIKTNYKPIFSDNKNSYISPDRRIIFVGFTHRFGKLRMCYCLLVGSGGIKNLQINNFMQDAYYYYESAFIFNPLVSLDYSITKRIALTTQIVYITS